VTSAKASQIKLFSAKITDQIESLSYLFVEDVKNSKSKPNVDGVYFSISKVISSFKEFIRKYQTVSDNESTFSPSFSRMTIIHKGLYQLQNSFKDMDAKIAIWVSNDPQFTLSDVLDTPLILTYVSRWPLIVHLLAACFCLGCSAIFHLI